MSFNSNTNHQINWAAKWDSKIFETSHKSRKYVGANYSPVQRIMKIGKDNKKPLRIEADITVSDSIENCKDQMNTRAEGNEWMI